MTKNRSHRRIWLSLVALAVATTVAKLAWGGAGPTPAPPNWLQWLDFAVSFGTLGTTVTVWLGERRERKLREQPIIIVVACESLAAAAELPIRPLRQHLNRAELLGILGMYAGPPRIETADLLPTFTPGSDGLSPLNLVVNGPGSQLTIQLTEATFKRIKSGIPQLVGPAPELPTPK